MRAALTEPHLDQERRRRSIDALVDITMSDPHTNFYTAGTKTRSIFAHDSSLTGLRSAAELPRIDDARLFSGD
jgi:hypothetical protein